MTVIDYYLESLVDYYGNGSKLLILLIYIEYINDILYNHFVIYHRIEQVKGETQ